MKSFIYVCVFLFTTLCVCVLGLFFVRVCAGLDALHEFYTTAGIYIFSVCAGAVLALTMYIEDNKL
jgi:hypothetical protein